MAQGYITDQSFEMCSVGIQIFGEYGYAEEYPQELLLRNYKITQIYEGTNGIRGYNECICQCNAFSESNRKDCYCLDASVINISETQFA